MPRIKKGPMPATCPSKVDWCVQAAQLQTGTADERWSAARALEEEPLAVLALDAALANITDSRLRKAIFTSLARQNSLAAFDAVLKHLRSDEAELRSFALDALSLMPAQIGLRLTALLTDDDPDIRVLTCELARQMPPQTAAPVLAANLKTEAQVNVCAAAVEVLAEIGDRLELPMLAVCATRFPAEFFLEFSVRAASERISACAGI